MFKVKISYKFKKIKINNIFAENKNKTHPQM